MLPADHTKAAIRARIRGVLDGVSREHWGDASLRVCNLVSRLPRFAAARSIFAFVPIGGEIDVTPLLRLSLDQGKVLCLPRIDWVSRTMVPASITALDDTQLETTRHAIRQPRPDRPEFPASALDLILVPAMAFAPRSDGLKGGGFTRLGRGAGFYDRFLSTLPADPAAATLGLALNEQILAALRADPWDIAIRAVATPDGVLGSV